MILVIFRRFLNFGPFFGPFLGTLVENSKHKKVAPGNSLNFPKKIKILTLIFDEVRFRGHLASDTKITRGASNVPNYFQRKPLDTDTHGDKQTHTDLRGQPVAQFHYTGNREPGAVFIGPF